MNTSGESSFFEADDNFDRGDDKYLRELSEPRAHVSEAATITVIREALLQTAAQFMGEAVGERDESMEGSHEYMLSIFDTLDRWEKEMRPEGIIHFEEGMPELVHQATSLTFRDVADPLPPELCESAGRGIVTSSTNMFDNDILEMWDEVNGAFDFNLQHGIRPHWETR